MIRSRLNHLEFIKFKFSFYEIFNKWETLKILKSQFQLPILGYLISLHLIISKPKIGNPYGFDFKLPENEIEVNHLHLTSSCQFLGDKVSGKVFLAIPQTKIGTPDSFAKFRLELGRNLNYFSTQMSPVTSSDKLWRILKNKFPDKSVRLFENDFIKIGKQIIKIHRIQEGSNFQAKLAQKTTLKLQKTNLSLQLTNNYANEIVCRICKNISSESSVLNYNVCNCAKDKPVHLECLADWLSQRCHKRFNKSVIYYDYLKLKCDDCGIIFPNEINLKNQKIKVIEFDQPVLLPHLILAVFKVGCETIVGYYVFEFQKGEDQFVRIGGGPGNQIRISADSVSENHAKLWWLDGKIYIYDENSNGGTAIKLPDIFSLDICKKQQMIMDQFLFSVHLINGKKTCSCFKTIKNIQVNPFVGEVDCTNITTRPTYMPIFLQNTPGQKQQPYIPEEKNLLT